jgi:hypothetical protein
MNELLNNLTSDEDVFVPLVFLGTGLIITVVAIVFTSVRKMVVSSNVEKSRREIAAYIAEGSMTPEDGERLLNAGPSCKS